MRRFSSACRSALPRTAIAGLATLACSALFSCGAALADTVEANFEAPTFHPGSVNGQDGWTSGAGFDQAVVATTGLPSEFGSQSLRFSNAVATGTFGDQPHPRPVKEAASETGPVNEYVAEFSFISEKPNMEQSGLTLNVSPYDGVVGRMAFIRLTDTSAGIELAYIDYPTPGSDTFSEYDLGTVARDKPHRIRLWIRLVPGENNDLARVSIDGQDAGACFTTWENYYAFVHEAAPEINTLLFRSGPPTTQMPGVKGGGFLLDNVRVTTSVGAGPPTCDLPIEKVAETHTVKPGGLVRYRISVSNDGSLSARNVLMCDRVPRQMTFVSADRKLARLGSRRCLLIPHLAAGQRVSFHPLLRVDANASAGTVDNTVEETPGAQPPGTTSPPAPDPGLPPGSKLGPIPPAKDATAKVSVSGKRSAARHRAPAHPAPPPPVTG